MPDVDYDLDETALEAALIEFQIAKRDGAPLRRALREAIAVYRWSAQAREGV